MSFFHFFFLFSGSSSCIRFNQTHFGIFVFCVPAISTECFFLWFVAFIILHFLNSPVNAFTCAMNKWNNVNDIYRTLSNPVKWYNAQHPHQIVKINYSLSSTESGSYSTGVKRPWMPTKIHVGYLSGVFPIYFGCDCDIAASSSRMRLRNMTTKKKQFGGSTTIACYIFELHSVPTRIIYFHFNEIGNRKWNCFFSRRRQLVPIWNIFDVERLRRSLHVSVINKILFSFMRDRKIRRSGSTPSVPHKNAT